ncbi:diguanylate cyclase [Marinobacteraceae bacterium S3BR75-40.1]
MRRQITLLLFAAIVLACVVTSLVVATLMHREQAALAKEQIAMIHQELRDRYHTFDLLLTDQERHLDTRLQRALPELARTLDAMPMDPATVSAETLDMLSARYGFDYIYIVNRDGIIVNTNFSKDQGLDLSKAGEGMARLLERLYGSGEVFSDRFNASIATGRLYKYAYYGPAGKDYIVEVAVDLRQFLRQNSERLDQLLFGSLFDLDTLPSDQLQGFDVFMVNNYVGWSLFKKGETLPEKAAAAFGDQQRKRLEIEQGDRLVVYERVPRLNSREGETDSLITKVVYDLSGQSQLVSLTLLVAVVMALVFGLVAFCLAQGMLQRWLLRPIAGLAQQLTNVAQGDFRHLSATGVEELDVITRGANTMVDEIADREERLLQAQRELENRVQERTVELTEANQELARIATTDPLTGLMNRRSFFEVGARELARIQRQDGLSCVVMLDLDHFKQINDTYGHSVGDRVLVSISRIFRQELRASDLAARLGGEEFGLLLPDTSLDQARSLVERVRRQVADNEFATGDEVLSLTLSAGIAPCDRNSRGLESVLQQADRALYEAKRNGRNRVALAESSEVR